jgi:hypothetical protein
MIRPLITATLAALVALTAWLGRAQNQDSQYPRMAPIEQYLMARDAEMALARSAAPKSISQNAEVLVLERQGYKTAAGGGNGFVCLVQRAWVAGIDDPEFWNPKIRSPICFNPPAARSYLPLIRKKTEWILAGSSKTQMFDRLKAAFDSKALPALASGAIGYMMSKEGHLNDRDGHWHPHVMFYVPETDPAAWGAGLPGSPIFGDTEHTDRLTMFLIPVGKWSDGSDASTTLVSAAAAVHRSPTILSVPDRSSDTLYPGGINVVDP